MEAIDLRIGNYVLFSEDSTVLEIEEISKNGLGVKNEIEDVWIEIDMFEPISLTEKWLIKFGFEYYKSNNSFQLDTDLGFSLWGRVESGINVYVNSDEIGETIKYVHQLQNLYFALTGEELTLKENNNGN